MFQTTNQGTICTRYTTSYQFLLGLFWGWYGLVVDFVFRGFGFKHWMWMIHASCSSMPCQKMTSERDPEITARYPETEAGYQRLYQMIRALRVTNEFIHQAESTHRSTVFSAHGSNMNHTEAPHGCEQSWYHAISFV